MKFTFFDLMISFLCGVALAVVIYDALLDRDIALMTSQTKVMAYQREVLNKCVNAYATAVDNSIVVKVIDDD